jgi:hypothetical protein
MAKLNLQGSNSGELLKKFFESAECYDRKESAIYVKGDVCYMNISLKEDAWPEELMSLILKIDVRVLAFGEINNLQEVSDSINCVEKFFQELEDPNPEEDPEDRKSSRNDETAESKEEPENDVDIKSEEESEGGADIKTAEEKETSAGTKAVAAEEEPNAGSGTNPEKKSEDDAVGNSVGSKADGGHLQKKDTWKFVITNIAENSKDLDSFFEGLSKAFKLEDKEKERNFFESVMKAAIELYDAGKEELSWSEINEILKAKGLPYQVYHRNRCLKVLSSLSEKIGIIAAAKLVASAARNNLGKNVAEDTEDDNQQTFSLEESKESIIVACPKLKEILKTARNQSSQEEKYQYLLDEIGFSNEENAEIRTSATLVMTSTETLLSDDTNSSKELSEDDLFDVLPEEIRMVVRGMFGHYLSIFFETYGSGESVKVSEFITKTVEILK